jgi:protein tyrosine/serine phosphatase
MKKLLTVLLLVAMACLSISAQAVVELSQGLPIEEGTITGFEKYGHATLDITIEKMFADGYELGDTVDVEFSNGYKFTNIPFYDGYYVAKGEPLLRAYPGHETIAVCINYGKVYEVAGLNVGDTVKISLNTKAGELDTQVLNSLKYTTSREDYASDEIYANFREVKLGNIGEGKLYRSCSPINNEHNRAAYANNLAEQVGIKSVLNLADSTEEIDSYIKAADFASPYYKELYEAGKVIALSMPIDFSSASFAQTLVSGIAKMVREGYETPVLVHCTEGKDRAGFTCALVEALMGASYDEIVADYMKSYENYYGINKENNAEKYDIIVKNHINEMIKVIAGVNSVEALTVETLEKGAKAYLLSGGMTEAEIDVLIAALK